MNTIESIKYNHTIIYNQYIKDSEKRHDELNFELFVNIQQLNNYTTYLINKILNENRLIHINPVTQSTIRPVTQSTIRPVPQLAIRPGPQLAIRPGPQLAIRPGPQLAIRPGQNRNFMSKFRVVSQLPWQPIGNQHNNNPIINYRVVSQLPGPYPTRNI